MIVQKGTADTSDGRLGYMRDDEKERHWPVPWAGTGGFPPLVVSFT